MRVHHAFALDAPDREGGVTQPQSRVAALFAVGARPTPVLDEKAGQVSAALGEVVGIQRPEHRVLGNAVVEALDELDEEPVATDDLVHGRHRSGVCQSRD